MKSKYVVTIVISLLFLALIAGYFSLILFGLIKSGLGGFWTFVVLLVATGFLGLMIYTMIERLKEQNAEDYDDYSKY